MKRRRIGSATPARARRTRNRTRRSKGGSAWQFDILAVTGIDLRGLWGKLHILHWATLIVKEYAPMNNLITADLAFLEGTYCAQGLPQMNFFKKKLKPILQVAAEAEEADEDEVHDEEEDEDDDSLTAAFAKDMEAEEKRPTQEQLDQGARMERSSGGRSAGRSASC